MPSESGTWQSGVRQKSAVISLDSDLLQAWCELYDPALENKIARGLPFHLFIRHFHEK